MKNAMKKLIAVVCCMLLSFSIAACSNQNTVDEGVSSATSGTSTDSEMKKIGVIQYAVHPSLDNCYTGFVEGLKEEGFEEGKNLTIDFKNSQGDTSNGDMMAKNMISSRYDLIAGIATPAAMSAYSAAKDTQIPVVFTAVSDPVSAGIVKDMEKPGVNCTGTADILPLEEQVKMIRAFLPDAKTIGILYTTSEPNSVSHLEKIKEIAPNYGFQIVEVGVTNASEVAPAASALVAKGVDCINNFTDNNVVDNLSSVLQAANSAKIPVFGSEVEQVKNGCLASQSIDYIALGKETGKMAAKILKGEISAEETAVVTVQEFYPVYNEQVCKDLGLALPEEYADAEAVTSNTAE